jgi:hypothetical protein
MTSRDFAYWLQGFFEIAKPDSLTHEQTEMVKRHLAMVFIHEIDPSMGGPKEQATLNEVHDLSKPPQKPYITQNGVYRC